MDLLFGGAADALAWFSVFRSWPCQRNNEKKESSELNKEV